MSNALGDLLPKGRFEEPPEVQMIKQFVLDSYQQAVRVLVQPNNIVIQVPSAALAGTLRMRLHELQELCETEKCLVIRIGQ